MMQRVTHPQLLWDRNSYGGRLLWGRWILANALGELIGLGLVAAIAGGFVWQFGEPRTSLAVLLMTTLMILLGAGEGLVLGFTQWLAVHPFFPSLGRREWMKATTMGAVIAWGLGMIPSTLIALQETTIANPPAEMSDAVKYSMASLMGLGLGVALGIPQWLVLRRYLRKSVWWIAANALAWAIGMLVIFFGAGAIPAGASGWHLLFLIALLLPAAGAIVGAIHGLALIWLLKK